MPKQRQDTGQYRNPWVAETVLLFPRCPAIKKSCNEKRILAETPSPPLPSPRRRKRLQKQSYISVFKAKSKVKYLCTINKRESPVTGHPSTY